MTNDTTENPSGLDLLEPVITVSELAAHLGVPIQTIYDLRVHCRGPACFRVGRELRIRVSVAQEWIARLETADAGGHGEEADHDR
jgi:hypothetical protein